MSTRIEEALERALSRNALVAPPQLGAALRAAVFPGGARVRPRLCLAVAEACGDRDGELPLAMAAAIELLHCASLVHDDMPCFDDAELRRGQPTIHRAFGESTALLVGDALIVAAFETVAAVDGADAGRVVSLVRLLARAAGSPHGLVAGQAWEAEPSVSVDRYHAGKTGALFVAASVGAAIAAGADGAAWAAVGERVGAAYQVADDLLDAFGDDASVGKPLGRDEALGRPNVALRLGCDGAVRRLRALADEACAAVPECPGAGTLRTILVQVSERLVPANLRQSAA